jgi:uncharacterized protein YdeI (YjbR/CyaY-like superfamily)
MRYTPRNREQWRNWLEKNHARETEVWLVFLKQHTGEPNVSYNEAVEEAVCFGWIDGVKRSIDEDRYMHRFTPRRADSKWSKLNKERAQRMIEAGQMAPAGNKSIELAKDSGRWTEPVSARTILTMPSELNVQFKRNKKAATFFASIAPSYQRQYIAWIATAKRPETKKRRVDEAIRLLKRGQKLGMR